MKTVVKQTKIMGRGVFAGKKFKKGAVVEESHCIRLTRHPEMVCKTQLEYYTFRDDSNMDNTIIALGVGSLFNHKNKANITYKYDPVSNTVVFKAARAIRKGEQLFIDYGYDPVAEKERREKWEQLRKLREEENGDSKQRQIEQAPDLSGSIETAFERSGAV